MAHEIRPLKVRIDDGRYVADFTLTPHPEENGLHDLEMLDGSGVHVDGWKNVSASRAIGIIHESLEQHYAEAVFGSEEG